MSGVAFAVIAARLDVLLRTRTTPDYPSALNGAQVEHHGPVKRIAAAVDCSMRTIRGAIAEGANLLLVHHGLFWGGLQPLTGSLYSRVRLLLDHDIALYSAHLPLDAHERFGNSRLLAAEIGLQPSSGFGRYDTIDCGVRGACDLQTKELIERLGTFARLHGGQVRASAVDSGRRTRHWAISSGAGANAGAIREASSVGVDTLITGEGPHWTAIDAEERDMVIVYAGHYVTETLGVRALAEYIASEFALSWVWVAAPTGL